MSVVLTTPTGTPSSSTTNTRRTMHRIMISDAWRASAFDCTAMTPGDITSRTGAPSNPAFTASFDAIGELFGSEDNGVAVKLDRLLDPYLSSQGVFDSRADSLKSSIEAINDRRELLNQRLAALQTRYTKQFNALDSLLAQLQGTSNFLAQQLGNLPGSTPLTRK